MSERKIERTFTKTEAIDARSHAEIGFVQLGKQDPYFHVLAGVEYKTRRGKWEGDLGRFACCADHDALRKHFPAFAHLVRWHLSSITSGPMHYEENAIYFAEQARAAFYKLDHAAFRKHLESFKACVAWGAVSDEFDAADLVMTTDDSALRARLTARLPDLMAAFRRDIDAAFPGMWDAALALVKEH